MNRFLSVVLKVTAVIYSGIFVIMAFVAVVNGFAFNSYMLGVMIVEALVLLAVALVAFAMLWGIGNVLRDVDEIKETNRTIMSQNRIIMNKLGCSNESLKYNLSDVAGNQNPPEPTWECPSCGKYNPKSIRNCKDCGYQK